MLTTRAMEAGDVPACTDLINHIIALGGSTAYEEPFTEALFTAHYLNDATVANVVLSGDRILGFQAVYEGDDHLFEIGSFTDRRDPVKGAGRALFEKTRADCAALGGVAILAKITADNTGGLAFYSRMGFEDERMIPADHTRSDGTKVDRIIKRYALT